MIPGVASDAPVKVSVNDFEPAAFLAIKNKRSYIKLHGSMNWGASKEDVIVLGGAKAETIDRFDILRMNNRIFRQALLQPGAKLLVVGYGFADPHINETIAVGVRKGLQVWIVDPKGPEAIYKQLLAAKASSLIWHNVVGHSSVGLDVLLESPTVEHEMFFERFVKA